MEFHFYRQFQAFYVTVAAFLNVKHNSSTVHDSKKRHILYYVCGSVTDELIELGHSCNCSIVIIKWTNRTEQQLMYSTNHTFAITEVLECYC